MPQTNFITTAGEAAQGNGASSLHDLFALTDEQILEIEPEAQDVEVRAAAADATSVKQNDAANATVSDAQAAPESEATQISGGPFSAPDELRALADIYPGGLSQAKTAAERARVLDDIDRAYFGAAGKSAEEASASRAQLAAMMMREDPAAFREMVFAGLRALGETSVAPPLRAASSAADVAPQAGDAGLKPGPTQNLQASRAAEQEAHVAAYVAFEKAANEELERSVGAAISRTIEQALPALSRDGSASAAGAQHAAPLQARLSDSVRQDVEQALKSDRQLGEQIAQILSARHFDNETRAQVVRLIGERARQLVPVAAKRALNEWTQTTLAAHRGRSGHAEAASARREVAPVNSGMRKIATAASVAANSAAGKQPSTVRREAGPERSGSRRVDYRKLSDEQILDL